MFSVIFPLKGIYHCWTHVHFLQGAHAGGGLEFVQATDLFGAASSPSHCDRSRLGRVAFF